MRRRVITALCASVSVAILMVTSPSASAAALQDFYLVKNNGVRFVMAQGLQLNGNGTFIETSAPSFLLDLPQADVTLTTTASAHVETLDLATCRAAVRETGSFNFEYIAPDHTRFGGDGPYTLSGTRQGTKVGRACAFTSPALTQFALTAHAVALYAVPPPPPPPTS